MMDLYSALVAPLPEALGRALAAACEELEQRWSPAQLQELRELLTDRLQLELAQVLACSPWVAQRFAFRPQLLLDLLNSGDLHRCYDAGRWATLLAERCPAEAGENALALSLRRWRQREQCRLIWRDMNRLDGLEGITSDLSLLAEHCLDCALDCVYRDMCADLGTPCDADGIAQRLVVIGMGKLGAAELNLSSDIDLMFAFPASGETRGGRRTLSNQDFFVRLARRLIALLDAHTGDGFVCRIDMRLRP